MKKVPAIFKISLYSSRVTAILFLKVPITHHISNLYQNILLKTKTNKTTKLPFVLLCSMAYRSDSSSRRVPLLSC